MSTRVHRLRSWLFVLTAALFASVCTKDSTTEPPLPPADFAGVWNGSTSDNSGLGTLLLILEQNAATVTGSLEGIDQETNLRATGTVSGTVSGRVLRGQFNGSFPDIGCAFAVSFTAELAGRSLLGTYSGTSCTGPVTNGRFNLAKSDAPIIGPSGGTVLAAGGNVVLVFPPGAVARSVPISVQVANAFPPDPGLVQETVFDLGPSGIRFAQPVHLTITYDESRLPDGFEESSLQLSSLVAGAWEPVSGSSVNVSARSVSGSIGSFSVYSVRAVPASAACNPQGSFLWPLCPDSREGLGQDYAQFNFVRAGMYHTGLDITAARPGVPVFAAAQGVVRRLDMKPGVFNGDNHCMGNVVIIDHSLGAESAGPFTLYAHLQAIVVADGVSVSQGTQIGTLGNTGGGSRDACPSFESHLHFEVKDRSVLGDLGDGGPNWGYTPNHPSQHGYRDPATYLHPVSDIPLTRVSVTAEGAGVHLRIGPASQYRCLWQSASGGACVRLASGDEFIASATSAGDARCSAGWYQIRREHGQFDDPERPPSTIPDAWVCRGDMGQEWVKPVDLAVSLEATPASGPGPLDATLTARVLGGATGAINYTFWWNCIDPGTSVDALIRVCGDPANSAVGARFNAVTDNPKTVKHAYSTTGNYTAKVLVERTNTTPAEARTSVTVTLSPDLTVAATVGSSYAPAQSVQIPVTVTRTGGNLTQGTDVTARLYWSSDAAWDPADMQLWTGNFPSHELNSAGSVTGIATGNIPSVVAGRYYVLAVVDPTNFHTENDENNNVTLYAVLLDDSRPNRAFTDRPDEMSGNQIHVMYVLPSDGVDRSLDLNGTLTNTVGSFQNWLVAQTGDRRLRTDVVAGTLDITFFRLSRSNAVMTSYGAFVRDTIEKELAQAGFANPGKIYAVYYDGGSTFACGGGAWPPVLPGRVAALYLQGTPPGAAPCNTNEVASTPAAPPGYLEFAMLHEILHTMGFVSTSAPHHSAAGHVSDDNRDLMYAGPLAWHPSILDVGRDDYYSDGVLAGVLNLANSPFLLPGLTLTVSGAGTGSGRVTSSPSLIDCTIDMGRAGAAGCSGSVSGVTTVTLNVTLWTGSTVTGWAGMGDNCSGTSCQVTMDQTRSVTLELGGRAGDLNNDGLVDRIDLDQLIADWGRTDKPPADINRDGIVDTKDEVILIRNWTGGLAVATEGASGVTNTSATLHGSVTPGPKNATAWFEWGTSPTLATFTTTPGQSLPAGTTAVSITATLSGLTAGTTYYFRAVASNSGGLVRDRILNFATPTALSIIGGTYFVRDAGLTGTAFLYDPIHDAGGIGFVDLHGPLGWNGGAPARCSAEYRPPGIADRRRVCWFDAPPITGEYTAEAVAGGQVVSTRFAVDASRQLEPPLITNVRVLPGWVTIQWEAPLAARSFLVRINPIPFTGITAETVLAGEVRSATLNVLSLEPGARYQAVVWAFAKDVKTPGDIVGSFDISTHSIEISTPPQLFASSGVGLGSPPSDLYAVEATAAGSDLRIARVATASGFQPVITDLAWSPGRSLWAISFDKLYRLNPLTGLATEVGDLMVSDANALALDAAGELFGATTGGTLVHVDTLTGQATVIGSLGVGLSSWGDLAFAPDGRLFATVKNSTGVGYLATVDRNTGQATPVADTPLGVANVWGLAFVGSTLFGLTTDLSVATGQLVTLDTNTGAPTFVRNLSFDAFGGGAVAPAPR